MGGASRGISPKLKLNQRAVAGSGSRRLSSGSRPGSPSDNMLLSVRSWRTTGQGEGGGEDEGESEAESEADSEADMQSEGEELPLV